MDAAEARSREATAAAGRRLLAEGLAARTWGNISVRIDERRMAITPSGMDYADIGPDEVVVVDLESGAWEGPRKPSGERGLHAAVYRARGDAGAVIHTHQSAASAFAAARAGLDRPEGPVRCAPYALPGTAGLVKGTVAALGSAEAVLMANHGALCAGTDLEAAFRAARRLEADCADRAAELDAAPAAAAGDSGDGPETAGGGRVLPARLDAPWSQTYLSEAPGGALLSRAPFSLAYAERGRRLPPVLDDLAQLVGWGNCRFVRGEGVYLSYRERGEAEAAAMVVEKACRAVLAGRILGGAVPLPRWEALLMRLVYTQSYGKRRNGT